MSSGYTIKVTGLSPETTTSKLTDFFSFCGKLLSVTKTEKEATLVFEKESAMRTSLMLNGGTLDGAHLEVTSATPVPSTTAPATLPAGSTAETPIGASLEQEDKPKAGIVAEYLAHGYILSDHIVQRAIEMDRKQGISTKFLEYVQNLDHKVGEKVVGPEQTVSGKLNEHLQTAVHKAQEVDQNRGISQKATGFASKAINHPIGQHLLSLYTSSQTNVQHIHNEAKRIAAEKKAAAGGTHPAAEADLATAQEKVEGVLPTGVSTSTSVPVPATTTAETTETGFKDDKVAPAAPGPVV